MAVKKATTRTADLSRAPGKPVTRKPDVTRAPDHKVKRTPISPVMATVHETMSGMYRLGLLDARSMRRFDRNCTVEVALMSPKEIAALRKREDVSQSVFAIHLNVTKSTVAQWESGQRKPAGPALKLLNLVEKKGLKILA